MSVETVAELAQKPRAPLQIDAVKTKTTTKPGARAQTKANNASLRLQFTHVAQRLPYKDLMQQLAQDTVVSDPVIMSENFTYATDYKGRKHPWKLVITHENDTHEWLFKGAGWNAACYLALVGLKNQEHNLTLSMFSMGGTRTDDEHGQADLECSLELLERTCQGSIVEVKRDKAFERHLSYLERTLQQEHEVKLEKIPLREVHDVCVQVSRYGIGDEKIYMVAIRPNDLKSARLCGPGGISETDGVDNPVTFCDCVSRG